LSQGSLKGVFLQAKGLPHFAFDAVAVYRPFEFSFRYAESNLQVEIVPAFLRNQPEHLERIHIKAVALGYQFLKPLLAV